MADLQELFSRLKTGSTGSGDNRTAQGASPMLFQPQILQRPSAQVPQPFATAQSQQDQQPHLAMQDGEGRTSEYRKPEVSSPIFSPPTRTPEPMHSSRIISPVSSQTGTPQPTGGTAASDDRRNQLLNLLKFNTNAATSPATATIANSGLLALPHRSASAATPKSVAEAQAMQAAGTSEALGLGSMSKKDLPARLTNIGGPATVESTMDPERKQGPSQETQDFLLNLLKQPAIVPSAAQTSSQSRSASRASAATQSQPLFSPAAPPVQFEHPQPQNPSAARFAYANPFDALHTSSPLNQARSSQADAGIPGDGLAQNTKDQMSVLPKESVSEALEDLGQQASRDVQDALERASAEPLNNAGVTNQSTKGKSSKKSAKTEDHESSWETQEDEEAAREDSEHVQVYNFPMLPFKTITLQLPQLPGKTFSAENTLPIAKHKKAFSQDDRCLATASQTYIVYAQPATKKDNFGFRVLRQDSGKHQQLFNDPSERVVDVRICSPPAGEEAVLATGENGTLYWVSLPMDDLQEFEDVDLLARAFIMPALAHEAEANPSGGAVKTRARCANRRTDVFAMSRGKNIYLVSTTTALQYVDHNHVADTASYFRDHSLIIKCPKSVKDFAFSQDDSCIVTLDKAGKVNFYDLASLLQWMDNPGYPAHDSIEVSQSLHCVDAGAVGAGSNVISDKESSASKISVSSVLLLDKSRPVEKGVALRYLLVGTKQNHSLQLWDMGLGKCVQVLHFPENSDTDGILSLSYSPKSGILAVGHPARNSVYFVHLSAPKYNLPSMSQADFVRKLADGDSSLPRPGSTAIMSGVRELSFSPGNKTELRSLDMLGVPNDKGEIDAENEALFELYASHSRGILTLSIRKQELGWDIRSGKVLKPVDAEKENFISMSPLTESSRTDNSKNDQVTPKRSATAASKLTPAKRNSEEPKSARTRTSATPSPGPSVNGYVEIGNEAAAQSASGNGDGKPIPSNPPLVTPESYTKAGLRSKPPSYDDITMQSSTENESAPSLEKSGPAPEEQVVSSPSKKTAVQSATTSAPASASTVDLSILLTKAMDGLYAHIDEDRRVQEATSAAKQDAILRLVSSTLTDNTEKSLNRIITQGIQQVVIPSLTAATTRDIGQRLEGSLSMKVEEVVKRELKTVVTEALGKPAFHKVLAESIGTKVKEEITHTMNTQSDKTTRDLVAATQNINNSQKQLAAQSLQAQESLSTQHRKDVERLLHNVEAQRRSDAEKIAALTSEVRALTEAIQTIAEGQLAFQRQISESQSARVNSTAASTSTPVNDNPSVMKQPEKAFTSVQEVLDPQADDEIQHCTQLLVDGHFEEATINWLQSPNQADLFASLFVKLNPLYLKQVSPLVALSVSAAITGDFDTISHSHSPASVVTQKLNWLETILTEVDLNSDDVNDVAPKILDVLSQRLQAAYMQLANGGAGPDVTKRVEAVARKVSQVRYAIR